MPGIAQVWLTHNELEGMLEAWDAVKDVTPPGFRTRAMNSGFDKLELALKPVACDTASGPKSLTAGDLIVAFEGEVSA